MSKSKIHSSICLLNEIIAATTSNMICLPRPLFAFIVILLINYVNSHENPLLTNYNVVEISSAINKFSADLYQVSWLNLLNCNKKKKIYI